MKLRELHALIDRLIANGYGEHTVYTGISCEALPVSGEIEMMTTCLVCAEGGECCGHPGYCRNDGSKVVVIESQKNQWPMDLEKWRKADVG